MYNRKLVPDIGNPLTKSWEQTYRDMYLAAKAYHSSLIETLWKVENGWQNVL